MFPECSACGQTVPHKVSNGIITCSSCGKTTPLKAVMSKGVSKYHNKTSVYNGYWYQSQHEANVARDLDLLLAGKQIKSWERQVVIPIVVHGKHITNYKVDFKVYHLDDSIELLEAKGMESERFRLIKALLPVTYLRENPDTRFRIIYTNEQRRWR